MAAMPRSQAVADLLEQRPDGGDVEEVALAIVASPLG